MHLATAAAARGLHLVALQKVAAARCRSQLPKAVAPTSVDQSSANLLTAVLQTEALDQTLLKKWPSPERTADSLSKRRYHLLWQSSQERLKLQHYCPGFGFRYRSAAARRSTLQTALVIRNQKRLWQN